jgi:hypothetical protein
MKRGRKPVEETNPEIVAALGTASDDDVAARFGVSTATVGNLRRKHKIPHFGSAAYKFGTYKPPPDQTGLVVVVSRYDGTTAQVLNSSRGIRVYPRDRLDYRITMGDDPPPYFETWHEAEAHLMIEPGAHRPCLIPLSVARKVFTEMFAMPDPLVSKLAAAVAAGTGVHLSADEVRAIAT